MPDPKETQISTSFISHLRQAAKVTCPHCGDTIPSTDDRIRAHLTQLHAPTIHGKDLDQVVREVKRGRIPAAPPPPGQDSNDDFRRKAASQVKPPRAKSTSPIRRSRARPQTGTADDPDFLPRPAGKLWNPEQDASRIKPSSRASRPSAQQKRPDFADGNSDALRLIKQPETRPISQEQLVAEVKGIYAGLVMVETKCIEVDNAQSSQTDTKLNNEQWQALIALHRTLLHEHHDFFLASQHPSASQPLRRLASKYAMPARMWRHGIHSFLELLRHRLPGSMEHMLTFIYLAYSMMALLFETVPAFEDTWIECLGDLGRYRMAIEDEDVRDREVWTSVSRQWYSKASDKAPTTGRLYHHLAILARPNALQQLFFYTKSLCVPIPFSSARESIMTLFEPLLSVSGYSHPRLIAIDVAFVKAHGVLFSQKSLDDFHLAAGKFLELLNDHVGRTTRRWTDMGYFIGIANCCALLSYGKEDSVIMKTIQSEAEERGNEGNRSKSTLQASAALDDTLQLVMGTHEIIFNRFGDANVLAYVHVAVVFMCYMSRFPNAMSYIEKQFPWKKLSLMLNTLLASCQDFNKIKSNEFPRESNDPPRPLPEDYALKGFVWVEHLFPSDWFSNEKIDDDEKYFEMPSMTDTRKERITWLAYRLAQTGKWLVYDETTNQFGVVTEYEKEIDVVMLEDVNMSEVADGQSNLGYEALDAMDVDIAQSFREKRQPLADRNCGACTTNATEPQFHP
ncbi:hypothetical protein F5Y16DRAFT_334160 [Xylariaceae sp. FL0255]|nr:hypothetical protein F5Y16DRAFT_334160 [Xylariaceae sp. FL0255]